jgi:hypothetical protein
VFNSNRQALKDSQVKDQRKMTRGYEPIKERGSVQHGDYYAKYQKKLAEEKFESFSTRDMMYFFRDTAEKSGVKYIIANPKVDMRSFRLCLERGYKSEEILVMIEFLFLSEQTYLRKNSLHPGILLTGWCNKIYDDSKLWLNDEYTEAPKKKTAKKNREWIEEAPEKTKTKIGEWDD